MYLNAKEAFHFSLQNKHSIFECIMGNMESKNSCNGKVDLWEEMSIKV